MRSLIQTLFGKKIFEVQPDGLIVGAPVWVEFLVKILTSVGITYLLFCLTPLALMTCAFIGSFVFYNLLVIRKLIKGNQHNLTLVIGDAFTDCSLAGVAFVGACFKLFLPLGLFVLALTYLVYRCSVRYASPGDR
jgi:hypothetical protein